MNYGNRLTMGAGTELADGGLTPTELWGIDKKMDDGRPGKGRVIAVNWDACTDSTSSSDLDGSYLLTETGTVCSVTFPNSF